MDIATQILIRRTIADSIARVSEKKSITVINIWLPRIRVYRSDINVTIAKDSQMMSTFLDCIATKTQRERSSVSTIYIR